MSNNNRVDLREKYPTVLARAFDVSPSPGWEDLVDRLIARMLDALEPEFRPQLRISQIKSKFAELRVSHNGDEEIEALVEAAGEEASRTCELCGAPGRKVALGGWVAVLCEDDIKKEGAR